MNEIGHRFTARHAKFPQLSPLGYVDHPTSNITKPPRTRFPLRNECPTAVRDNSSVAAAAVLGLPLVLRLGYRYLRRIRLHDVLEPGNYRLSHNLHTVPCRSRGRVADKFREHRFDGVDDEEDRPLIAQFCGNCPETVVSYIRGQKYQRPPAVCIQVSAVGFS